MRLSHALVAVLAAAALLAGCGEERDVVEEDIVTLNEVDSGYIADAQEQIELLCRSGSAQPRTLDRSLARVVDVLERNPRGGFESGESSEERPVREVVEDFARQLRTCGAEDRADRLLEAAVAAS